MCKKALKTTALDLSVVITNKKFFSQCVSEHDVTKWNVQISAQFKVMYFKIID